MKIAVEGCAHGELEKIYESIQLLQENENIKVDLLICCGDFQSTRNLEDLRCMAVPPKYYDICTFYKYYSGEKKAPILTVFIGGNHEASNYLQELPYGGWVAPNIYYLGYAGVINIAGIRIGGISGIYKGHDYLKGRYEKAPYNDQSKRSVYHIRSLEVFRLKQISENVDIFLSHDWPSGIHRHGNVQKLLRFKPFLRDDIESNRLGSPPCEDLLKILKPNFWFAAHLHCKFAALVPHSDLINTNKSTKFLALDKCLPKRKFLQVIDISHDANAKIEINYDLEWLTILYLTNHLLSIKENNQYMPGPGSNGRWKFTPTQEEKDFVLQKLDSLKVPLDFVQTATPYMPSNKSKNIKQPSGQTNPQTNILCEKLGLDDPTNLVLMLSGADEKSFIKDFSSLPDITKQEEPKSPIISSCNNFIPRIVEIKQGRLNMSLPDPKIEIFDSQNQVVKKLSLTLPAPKIHLEDVDDSFNISDSTEKNLQELDPELSINNMIFSDGVDISTSTPQKKKFKRRNESIYKVEDEQII